MIRRAFLRRAGFAALASGLLGWELLDRKPRLLEEQAPVDREVVIVGNGFVLLSPVSSAVFSDALLTTEEGLDVVVRDPDGIELARAVGGSILIDVRNDRAFVTQHAARYFQEQFIVGN